jgi:hypothetical protein
VQTGNFGDDETYIGHLLAPSGESSPYNFSFDWEAPSTPVGDITFYLAAVGANNNSSTSGDGATTSTLTISDEVTLTTGIRVQAKVLLEGAYLNSGLMRTDLLDAELLPNNQPFSTEPWLYNDEIVVNDFPPNISDWVLLELRDENNTSVVAQKAGFVRNDGILINSDGSEGIVFEQLVSGNYYIIVRPRNHVAVMSSNSLELPNLTTYDFTSSALQAKGDNQMVALNDGSFALAGGDVNSDGVITVTDFNIYQNNIAALNSYSTSDIDLNSSVTVSDFNVYVSNISYIGVQEIRYN